MPKPAPFGDCKLAALHQISAIQSHGGLIAIDVHRQIIIACSENISSFLGKTPDDCLGQPAINVFGRDWMQLARTATQVGRHRIGILNAPSGNPVTVIGHRQGDYAILELEPSEPRLAVWWDHAARVAFFDALAETITVDRCIELLVETVFQNSRLDRVMCYRFLPDWHGEVIRESCRPGVDGFLGLRFPASDFPANARQLYTLNWQRVITDVDSTSTPLRYWTDQSKSLDMTYSLLRAVHPVHIQYLHNMGVQASLSLSLVVNGKLWGLIACHHLSPITLGIHERLALEEIAKLVSLHLKNLIGLSEQERQSRLREKLSKVRGALQKMSDNPQSGLASNLATLRDLFQANGVWLHFRGEEYLAGLTPEPHFLSPLRDWLDLLPNEQVSHYHQLPKALMPYPALVRNASGAMYIPLSSSDFIVVMRQEVAHVVNWAGQPAFLDENNNRSFTPQNSFSNWAQEVRNSAEPWEDSEMLCAESLRKELIDYISFARLEQVALHDPLTGLANRLQFAKKLQDEVRSAFSRNSHFAVHMIDLDKFKPVNDTHGHAAGDALLKAVSLRLMQLVRTQDTVARLGGDEFAVIQSGISDSEAALNLAQRIVRDVAKPYQILGQKVEISTSVGVALFPTDTSDEDELLANADLALYAVKKAGRNAFSMFIPTMREGVELQTDVIALLTAIEQDQLKLYYQPIVDARSGELRGLESLICWQHPEKGLLTAEQFMPLAEKLLARETGQWVLNAVFQQHKTWQAMGLPTVPISVNISSAQFSSEDLLDQIISLTSQYDVGCEWLCLDVKQEAILQNISQAIHQFNNLHRCGIAAQLDNFGRGFISLDLLTQLPFLGIKFDASTLYLDEEPNVSMAVLNIVKSIANALNQKLTITRIESEAVANWMRQPGVDLLQGDAIAAPVSAEQVLKWFATH